MAASHLVILLFCFSYVLADVYLHNPRGSNNRLNEKSAKRTRANRLFDSQNNNRGGYNVGDRKATPFTSEGEQYNMKYYTSSLKGGQSELTVEWTNQHGCGGSAENDPHKQNCQIILQFMCGPHPGTVPRNGESIEQQDKNTESAKRGLHESLKYYERCSTRDRNKGLFSADQLLKGTSAIFTRQNPGGQRSGYECPEERDYHPYWHPSPWIDIAVLTDDVRKCSFYKNESFNGRPRGECVVNTNRKNKFNNAKDCRLNGGQWVEFYQYLEKASMDKCSTSNPRFRLGVPWDSTTLAKECLVIPPSPDCLSAAWSRSNHLGDVRGKGHAMRYTWRLPVFPSGASKRCVFRIRYNISTDDYDSWHTNASFNGEKSPIQNDPLISIDDGRPSLRLAIDTAQLGRTFQDRSHVFELTQRPSEVSPTSRLVNLNVRGKRGNIVQVYPAVEYDFIPNRLSLKQDDLIHIQWTGSNTHNNGNPAEDGQAGNDGQGTEGTDRHNWLELSDPADNFPTPFEFGRLFNSNVMTVVWNAFNQKNVKDVAIQAASAGYFRCARSTNCAGESMETKTAIDKLLNNAPASFPGFIFRLKKGKYFYMCSRNNNFSNRSQKGHIIVS